jgi:hypothetical protein
MPDAGADKVPAAYLSHLTALGPTVPDAARRLAGEVSLHDGLLSWCGANERAAGIAVSRR